MTLKPRDPDRIPVMLDQIRLLWQAKPDLRLCQLLYNVLRPELQRRGSDDIFHIEDELLNEMVQDAVVNGWSKK